MATIYLNDDIGKDMFGNGISADDVIAQIACVPEGEALSMVINSLGGSVTEGLAVYHALKECGHDVTTKVQGIAASIASVIFMAGTKREIGLGSFLLVHDCWTATQGNAEELMKTAGDLDTVSSGLADIYSQTSGLSKKKVEALMDARTLLDASTSVKLGFATSVVNGQPITVSAKAHNRIMAMLSPKDFEQLKELKIMDVENQKPAPLVAEIVEVVNSVDTEPEGTPQQAPVEPVSSEHALADAVNLEAEAPVAANAAIDVARVEASSTLDIQAKAEFPAALPIAKTDASPVQDAASLEIARIKAIRDLAFDGYDWFEFVEAKASVQDAIAVMYEALKEKHKAVVSELDELKAKGAMKAENNATLDAIRAAGAAVPVADVSAEEDLLGTLHQLKGAERHAFFQKHEAKIKQRMRRGTRA